MHRINPKEWKRIRVFYYFQGQFHIFKGNFTKFQDNSRTNGTILKFQEFSRTKVKCKDFSSLQVCANPVIIQFIMKFCRNYADIILLSAFLAFYGLKYIISFPDFQKAETTRLPKIRFLAGPDRFRFSWTVLFRKKRILSVRK